MQLLIATTNQGKLHEYRVMLADLPVELVGLREVGLDHLDVEETGATYHENAVLKAQAYAQASGLYTLADDSGLSVAALNGRPGVYSARYGGHGLDDAGRRRKLLDELGDAADRRAGFECVTVIAQPDGTVYGEATGVVTGQIADDSRGSGGFGYDPLFIPDGYDQTFGELDPALKDRLSHRGRAVEAIKPLLRELVGGD